VLFFGFDFNGLGSKENGETHTKLEALVRLLNSMFLRRFDSFFYRIGKGKHASPNGMFLTKTAKSNRFRSVYSYRIVIWIEN
jgi:hypothetical protein